MVVSLKGLRYSIFHFYLRCVIHRTRLAHVPLSTPRCGLPWLPSVNKKQKHCNRAWIFVHCKGIMQSRACLETIKSSSIMFSILFPQIRPVAIHIGWFSVRWYALSYIVGIFLGWALLGKLNRRTDSPLLAQKPFDDIVMWAVLGVLLGGRLGYAFFYNSDFFLANPTEIISVWKGGMSFHGGLLGVIGALAIFCRVHGVPPFSS